ncbi:unnamed protein product [Moneuplotes crassus]|uniref:Uncharacterized protein n=1 Tax=Euplotes crassus TaxID=5936 RepID=A0AAD1UKX2_EUPCR|nr:unnamed protein product [Moneuplotes crassus]
MITSSKDLSKPILLTKNGKEHYKTVIGGLATIVIFLCMTAYLVLLVKTSLASEVFILTKSKTSTMNNNTEISACQSVDTSTNTSTSSGTTLDPDPYTYSCSYSTTCPEKADELCSPYLGTDISPKKVPFSSFKKSETAQFYSPAYLSLETHFVFRRNFNLAFKWRNHTYNPNSFTLEVFLRSSQDGGLTIVDSPLELIPCNTTLFTEELEDHLTAIGIEDYLCLHPNNSIINNFYRDAYLLQNSYGSNYTYLAWEIRKCTIGACDGEPYDGTLVDLLMVDSEYKYNSTGYPFESKLITDQSFLLHSTSTYNMDFKLHKNLAVLPPYTMIDFYKILAPKSYSQFQTSSPVLARGKFEISDSITQTIERDEYQPKIGENLYTKIGDNYFGDASNQRCYWYV